MDEKRTKKPQEQFQKGDRIIVLYQGRYNGMHGTFLGIRRDPNWADIEELPGMIHAHPVAWIRRIDHHFDVSDIRAESVQGIEGRPQR